jgi:hypothetical protein
MADRLQVTIVIALPGDWNWGIKHGKTRTMRFFIGQISNNLWTLGHPVFRNVFQTPEDSWRPMHNKFKKSVWFLMVHLDSGRWPYPLITYLNRHRTWSTPSSPPFRGQNSHAPCAPESGNWSLASIQWLNMFCGFLSGATPIAGWLILDFFLIL